MKKKHIVIIFIILIFATVAVLKHCLFADQNQRITSENAEKLCYSVLGEKDEETDFPFSFRTIKIIEKDGKEYYVVRASWLVNNSHMSYIGDFFVSMDGKEIYDGFVNADEYSKEKLIWREWLVNEVPF